MSEPMTDERLKQLEDIAWRAPLARDMCHRAFVGECVQEIRRLREENALANTKKHTASMETERYKQKLMVANREISELRKVVDEVRRWNCDTPDCSICAALRELDEAQ